MDTNAGPQRVILHKVLHVPCLVEYGGTIVRLSSKRACHTVQGDNDLIFTYSTQAMAIFFGEFDEELDYDYYKGIYYTLHTSIIKTPPLEGSIALIAHVHPLAFVARTTHIIWHMRTGRI